MIGILVNPNAGLGGREVSLQQLQRAAGPSACIRVTSRIDDIPAALQEFRECGVTVLVPWGGDGTVSCVLSYALSNWPIDDLPSLFIVPGGTMNMVANHLQPRRRNSLKQLAKLRKALAAKPEHSGSGLPGLAKHQRHLLQTSEGQAGFTLGMGAVARFLEEYQRRGESWRGAVSLLGRAAGSAALRGRFAAELFKPLTLEWRADGGDWQPAEWNILLAMTIDHLPLRFCVTPGAGGANQPLHLLYGHPSARFVVSHLRQLYTGSFRGGSELQRGMAEELQLKFAEPSIYMVDGEVYPARSELSVTLGPAVNLLTAP